MGVLITTALLCHYSIETGLSGLVPQRMRFFIQFSFFFLFYSYKPNEWCYSVPSKRTKSQFLKVVNYNAKQVGQVLKLGFMGLHMAIIWNQMIKQCPQNCFVCNQLIVSGVWSPSLLILQALMLCSPRWLLKQEVPKIVKSINRQLREKSIKTKVRADTCHGLRVACSKNCMPSLR